MNNTDRAAYVSNALYQTRKSGNWSGILTLRTVRDTIKSGKAVSDVDLQKIKTSYDKAYATRNDPSATKKFDSEVVNVQYDFWTEFGKLGVPGAQNVGDFVRQDLERIHSGSMEDRAARNALENNTQKSDYFAFANENPAQVISDVLEIIETTPDLRSAVDSIIGPEWQAQTTNSAGEIQDQNPDFNESLKLNQLLTATGEIKSDSEELKTLLKGKILGSLDDIKAGQNESVAKMNSLISQAAPVGQIASDVAQILSKIKAESEAKTKREIDEWNDNSLQSIASVTGLIIGDKKLAREINAVVDSYIKIKNLTNQYNSASAAAATLQTGMGAIGAIGLVCGYIGVAIALYSVLSASDGPSAEEIILDAVKQLSEQLEDARRQIMDGLKVLDKKLSDFMKETADNFETIRDYLNRIVIDLDNAQGSLRNISIQLNQLWAEVDEKLDFLIDADFKTTQSNIYDFKTDNGREMSKGEFVGFLTKLRAFFRASKEEIFTGDPDKLADLESLHTAIEKKTAADCINILRKYAEQNGEARYDGVRCNPNRVNLLADLLCTMVVEHPSAFSEIPSTKLFKDVYWELKTDRLERNQLLLSKGDTALISIVEALLRDYQESVEQLVEKSRTIRREELVRNPRISDKGPNSNILKVLKVFSDISTSGFRTEEPDGLVRTFHENAIEKLAGAPAVHGETDSWNSFYLPTEGPVDFGVLAWNPTAAGYFEQWMKQAELRGNPTFPVINLTPSVIKGIFERCPLASIGINLGLFELDLSYYTTIFPFGIEWDHISGSFSGAATIYFKVVVKVDANLHILARPKIRDSRALLYWTYLTKEWRLPKLREAVVNPLMWVESPDFGQILHQAELDAANTAVSTWTINIVEEYATQVKERLLRDLANPSSDLYASAQLVETRAKLLKLFCEYLFRYDINLMTDRLSFIVGDLKKDYSDSDSFFGEMPLVDNGLLKRIVSTYTFPSRDADAFDIAQNCDYIDLHFLDDGLIEKTAETTRAIAEEVTYIVSRISTMSSSARYYSTNFVGMEMIVASTEFDN